jgi:tRNA(adenine34) deaminase
MVKNLMSEILSETSAADRFYMKLALAEAHAAARAGEIPVGAVVVYNGGVISRAHNRREELQSPVAHAELLALEAAAEHLKSWRLEECCLYVTLEPCLMCVGAILQARVARLVFGCLDPKAGAVESLYRLCDDSRLNHTLPVTRGIMESECGAILSEFFADLRKKKLSAFSSPQSAKKNSEELKADG